MVEREKKFAAGIAYTLLLLAVSIPLLCGYVMEGGRVLLWLARGEEMLHGIRAGEFYMYPSLQLVTDYEGYSAALDTNLWLLPYVLVRLLGATITSAYRVSMFLIQLGTLLTTGLLFRRLLGDNLAAFSGMVLYLTCPYRLWLCYDLGNLGRSVSFMLLPLIAYGAVGLIRREKKPADRIITVLALAGLGYADQVMLVIVSGSILLASVWYKRAGLLLAAATGIVVWLPGGIRLFSYLLGMTEYDFPVVILSANGYYVGRFFTAFAYRDGMPGLGLSLMGALLLLVWLRVTGLSGKKHRQAGLGFFTAAGICMLILSLAAAPWEMVQRLGAPLLRWVSLIESPAVFFGVASALLCIPAAAAVGDAQKQRSAFVRRAVPVILLIAGVATGIYLCNSLTYSRMPMYLLDTL